MTARIAVVTALAWLVLSPATAFAACPQTSVAELEDEVMCPVCGTTLGVAREAPQARRQRAFIERLVGECKSEGEIKSALVSEFGDGVLATPSGEGFGLSAYLVPALAAAAALAGVGGAALRWRRRAELDRAAGD
jgi:cytochrome c-type biogenesis protein CcmH